MWIEIPDRWRRISVYQLHTSPEMLILKSRNYDTENWASFYILTNIWLESRARYTLVRYLCLFNNNMFPENSRWVTVYLFEIIFLICRIPYIVSNFKRDANSWKITYSLSYLFRLFLYLIIIQRKNHGCNPMYANYIENIAILVTSLNNVNDLNIIKCYYIATLKLWR